MAAVLATPTAPPVPPARRGPPARSILADRVLKLNPPGSSRKRGQSSTSPAAPAKKPRPTSGGGDKDAADAADTLAAPATGDTRVPDPNLQGTGPVAGSTAAGGSIPATGGDAADGDAHQASDRTRQVARDAPTAPAPTEVRVIDLTGEDDDDAPEEVASAGTLQQTAPELAEDATVTAGGDVDQPLPAEASSGALEMPPSPRPAPSGGQGAAGLGQVGGTSPSPDAASGSQTAVAGSSTSAGAAFSLGAGELAGRSWG
ncbi:skin secretory protein xP2-like [Brachypodium distachyon]|uniref:skin secretory protein xP2-like n=1 Tax=Brachypodium distachyon TaxID=15368 RepID=UPI000D0D064B|nr:skin secretory protein xP2-like [Brachypodium distachyon]|eukprot:XP_024317164.1 skin secretory protein xP2-like [Brachypodium distachyon]